MKMFLLVFLALVFSSCTTPPTQFKDVQSGQWDARVLIRDKVRDKSNIVRMEIISIRPQSLRMDVTASLGVGVASFAMNKDKVSLALLRQQKYFVGPVSAQSLTPLVNTPFDPKWLINILFDLPLPTADWKCDRDPKGFLRSCQNAKAEATVEWRDRELNRRTVLITTKKADIQMQLKGFQTNVQAPEGTFFIQRPDGFQILEPRTI